MKFYALLSLALLGVAGARPSAALAASPSSQASVSSQVFDRDDARADDDDDSDDDSDKKKKRKHKNRGRGRGIGRGEAVRNGDMCWDRNRNGICDEAENGTRTGRRNRDDVCVDRNRDGRCDDILTSGTSTDVLGAILRGGMFRLR